MSRIQYAHPTGEPQPVTVDEERVAAARADAKRLTKLAIRSWDGRLPADEAIRIMARHAARIVSLLTPE